MREGKLSDEARNRLLAGMTEEVAALVLRNNYLQTLALSLAERQAAEDLGFENRLMQMLEARDLLDRGVEFLPSDADIAERRAKKTGLTRPELAVTLAYAKLTLFDDLLASGVPDDPYLARELDRYFPQAAHRAFSAKRCKATACGARSSRRCLRTRSSTAAGRPSWRGSPTKPARRRRKSRRHSRRCAIPTA